MATIETTSFIGNSLKAVFASFFGIGIKLFFVVIFVIIVLFFTKKFVKYFQQVIVEHNAYEENAISFSNIVGDVFFYLVLVFSACIGLYVAGFQSAYIFLGATFATGYAFKELFQSLISGILIMTTKEFVIGDLIEVYINDLIYFGRIDSITIRYTVVRKLDMTRVIIPNRLLTRVPVMTFSAEENIRLQTTFSLVLSPQINKVLQLTKETIMSLDSITEKDFTLVTIDNFSEGCVHIVAYFYFDPKQGKMRFRVISEVNTALSEVFMSHGIAFAFPHVVTTFDSPDTAIINLMEQYKQHL